MNSYLRSWFIETSNALGKDLLLSYFFFHSTAARALDACDLITDYSTSLVSCQVEQNSVHKSLLAKETTLLRLNMELEVVINNALLPKQSEHVIHLVEVL
ncbi:unnamed protein product [Lathyrus sativus]|nr:unnamed protein product [Lathyrus sativus]